MTVWSIRLLATTVKKKRYPVLYLQHGGGENETNWFWQAKLNFILDNLLAEEKAEEMIVVCNSGEVYRNGEKPTPMDFEALLMQDVIPFINNRFRVWTFQRRLSGFLHWSEAAWQISVYRHVQRTNHC